MCVCFGSGDISHDLMSFLVPFVEWSGCLQKRPTLEFANADVVTGQREATYVVQIHHGKNSDVSDLSYVTGNL